MGDIWGHLTKLSELPALSAELELLSDRAANAPEQYCAFWVAALERLGSSAHVLIEADGTRSAMVGYPCGPDEEERSARIDAVKTHYRQTGISREKLLDQLEERMPVYDRRPRKVSEIVAVVRTYLAHGGRIMINPDGNFDSGLPAQRFLAPDAPDPVGAYAAIRALDRLRSLGRNNLILKRIVRMVGTCHENGWIVVDSMQPKAPRPKLSLRYGGAA